MKKYLIVAVILGVWLTVIPGQAEADRSDTGQFLRIGAGARASGMGEAFCAVSDDTYALYYNPAGLGQLTQKQVSFLHSKWLRDLRYESLFYAKPYKLKELGAWGASITYLDMDELIGRDKDSKPIGNFGAKDFAFQLSSGLMFGTDRAFGMSLKYIQQEIENEDDAALAVDIGLLSQDPLKNIKWGMAIQNIGTRIRFINKKETLPFIYRGGISCKVPENNLLVSADITRVADSDWRLSFGLEHLATSVLTLRCGYTFKNDLDNVFSFGAGFNFPVYQLDYAYVPYDDLGGTHRFSISFRASTDSDKDGVYDGLDQCPATPEGATVDAYGCPIDSDKDGVYDGLDQSPATPEGATVDAQGCPIDSDKDGVYDGLDQSPATPEGATVDAYGCPIDS
ncbi:MAG: PorV/PorQ family protein, partial [Candidatus Desantisbacteria bacterium]